MLSKRLLAVLTLTMAFLVILPLSGAFASSGVADNAPQPQPEAASPNLLTNPGMDGKYVKQCAQRYGQPWVQVPCPTNYDAVVGEVKQWETTQVPFGWSAWWQPPNSNFSDPNYFNTYPAYCPDWKSTPPDCKAWHNPEYRDTLGGPQDTGPSRKVAGDNSQKYFTFYSVHEAGLYQVVSGVKPGEQVVRVVRADRVEFGLALGVQAHAPQGGAALPQPPVSTISTPTIIALQASSAPTAPVATPRHLPFDAKPRRNHVSWGIRMCHALAVTP